MFNRLTAILVVGSLFVGGCSTSPRIVDEKHVVTIDPESLDYALHGEMKYEPTPDHVVVGERDGVIIEVFKREMIEDELADNQTLQIWDAVATNTNSTPKCVTPLWRLMDFEYISNGPSEQLVGASSMVRLGEMQQRTWIIDKVPVAPPPSGYLADLRIRNPAQDAKPGDECTFITPEHNIKEQ